MFVITTATEKISKARSRVRAFPGGTSAGKTIGILQVLIDLSQQDKTPKLTSIVSESFPHLRRGCIRDFMGIMKESGYWRDSSWNATNFIYLFETGSQIEFFSADQPDKLRGARRDRLFINEANNIEFDAFEQLEVRTKDAIFLDWNPTNEFWYYTDVKNGRSDIEECTLTYLDNEVLDSSIVASIEQRKDRKGWWQVYGLGQLGEVEGRIYKDWQFIDDIPYEAQLIRRGLDFGYTNDPTAVVDIYRYNGGYILDEACYQNGLSNKQIADIINALEPVMVVADSSEPKSIDEIKKYGITIVPATKGKGSVSQGIQFVQAQKIWVTKRSVNLIKEYRNYLWMTDRNGKVLNEPEGGLDHALDATRYALSTIRQGANTGVYYPSNLTANIQLRPEEKKKEASAITYYPKR